MLIESFDKDLECIVLHSVYLSGNFNMVWILENIYIEKERKKQVQFLHVLWHTSDDRLRERVGLTNSLIFENDMKSIRSC